MKLFRQFIIYCAIFAVSSVAYSQQFLKPSSMAFDSKRQVWYVANAGEVGVQDGSLIKRFSDGKLTYLAKGGLTDPKGLFVSGDSLYFTDGSYLGVYDLSKYTISSLQKISQAGELIDICMDNKGRLFVSDDAGYIHRINASNFNDRQMVAFSGKKPRGLCFDKNANRIIFGYFTDASPIDALDVDNLTVMTIAALNLPYPVGIAKDSKGANYVSCQGSAKTEGLYGKIYKYNSIFSDPGDVFIINLSCPGDISIDSENDVLGVPLSSINDIAVINLEKNYKCPVLLAPVNNEVEVGNVLTLSWTEVQDASKYVLNISKTATFDSLVLNIDWSEPQLEVGPLDLNTKYYWRVKAISAGRDGAWSLVRNFRTANRSYNTPARLSPADGFKYANPYPIFTWKKEKAGIYKIQIAEDIYMNALVYSASNITDTVYRTIKALEENQTYYWRVKTYSGMVESAWSPVWSFRTETFRYYWPPLISPENFANNVEPYTTLTWESRYPGRYSIIVSKDEYFYTDTILYVKEYKDTTYTFKKPLSPNTQYYWKVQTHDDTTGSWSGKYEFKTAIKSGVEAEITTQSEIYPNPCVNNLSIENKDFANRLGDIVIYSEDGIPELKETALFDWRGKISLNLKDLLPGNYLMIITGDNLKSASKICIKR